MLSTIFSTCAKLSPPAVNTALQVWNQVKDLSTRFNTVAINALINVFATSGDIKSKNINTKKRKKIEKRKKCHLIPFLTDSEYFFRKLELYGLKPDVNSYNSLIFACCENKPLPNYERARFWFDSISANGLKPDDYSYSSLISAAAKSNNVESGLRFFREVLFPNSLK